MWERIFRRDLEVAGEREQVRERKKRFERHITLERSKRIVQEKDQPR